MYKSSTWMMTFTLLRDREPENGYTYHLKDHIDLIVTSNIIQPKLHLRSMRLRIRKLLRKEPVAIL